MSLAERIDRGFDVVPNVIGDQFLSRELVEAIRNHPLAAGESSWGTRNLLLSLILSTRPRVVLEVGSHIGAGAVTIGSALRANGFGRSFHLEPQDQYHQLLQAHIDQAELAEWSIPLRTYSTDPMLDGLLGGETDLIFLDANHDYSGAFQDLTISERLLSNQGLIILDDVADPHSAGIDDEGRGGVRQAALDFVALRSDLTILFLEPPFWLDPRGLAIIGRRQDAAEHKLTF